MPARKGKPRIEGARVIRTSLVLPESLWQRAKIRAVQERTDLRALIIRGLETILSQKPKREGK